MSQQPHMFSKRNKCVTSTTVQLDRHSCVVLGVMQQKTDIWKSVSYTPAGSSRKASVNSSPAAWPKFMGVEISSGRARICKCAMQLHLGGLCIVRAASYSYGRLRTCIYVCIYICTCEASSAMTVSVGAIASRRRRKASQADRLE